MVMVMVVMVMVSVGNPSEVLSRGEEDTMRIFKGSRHRKWRTQLTEPRLPYTRVVEIVEGTKKRKEEDRRRIVRKGCVRFRALNTPFFLFFLFIYLTIFLSFFFSVHTDPRIYVLLTFFKLVRENETMDTLLSVSS